MPTEPTGPNDPEVTDSSGDQLQPGPGASGFIDRPTGLPGESANLSGSPGSASEPALVAPGSSLVTDAKINADDTGRLVSGTDANGNKIPPDTFVGAVSDTGPYSLGANASTTTASNNYAKPWIGTFQLLNDSGQPVTLPNGYDGNVTLSAEGGTSTVGTASCPSASAAATSSACVTADPLYDATDFTPGGGDTGTVLISPLITPGTVSSTYYNHYSTLRTLEDLFLTGRLCTNTLLVAGSVCGGLDGEGHIGYAAQSGLADFGPDVFTAQSYKPAYPLPRGAAPGAAAAHLVWCSPPIGRPGAMRAGRSSPARFVRSPLCCSPPPCSPDAAVARSYPAYLPKSTLDPTVDRALTGTMARPAFTVEGLAVDVKTRAFDVSVTVSGPIVPGEGLPYQTPATTCTWTVTMKDATADVPVSLARLPRRQPPRLIPGPRARARRAGPAADPSPGPRPAPSSSAPTSWSVRGRCSGPRIIDTSVAMWDYEVEND